MLSAAAAALIFDISSVAVLLSKWASLGEMRPRPSSYLPSPGPHSHSTHHGVGKKLGESDWKFQIGF